LTVDQATRLRQLAATGRSRARVIAVTSGKGGVGKSNIALNLAIAAAADFRRVVVVDADFGLANLDVLCGVPASAGLADVVAGKKRLYEVALPTPFGVELVTGASGISFLADLPDEDRTRFLAQMDVLEGEADLIVIDTGAGIARNVIKVAAAADDIIVVTTPEPTSITDAYAAVKLISREREHGCLSLVVNQAASREEARSAASRIVAVARQFLATDVQPAGFVPADPCLSRAVRIRRPLVAAFPNSPAALCIKHIAKRFRARDAVAASGGFMNRLKRLFGR